MKAVIPSAGLGTRLLPATKAVPKVMLPVVDRPVLQWAVEEAAAAGIDEVCLVIGGEMQAVRQHFGGTPSLVAALEARGKAEEVARVRAAEGLARITFVEQPEAKGLGHAVHQAARVVGEEPFAVLLPDVIIAPAERLLSRMAEVHRRTGGCVLALYPVEPEAISSYGCAAVRDDGRGAPRVTALVEKPSPEDAPSNLSVAGRYLLTPAVMQELEAVTPGAGGEIQLTDAIAAAMEAGEPVHGVVFESGLYDTGSVAGMIEANLALGLADSENGSEVRLMVERFSMGE